MINFWFVFMPVFAISMLGLSIAYFALSSNKEGESGGHKLLMKFILIAAISAVISAYISLNPWSVVKGDTAEVRAALLGQMGDFFGGMLNPILAFASFIALLYTIRIQSQEIKEAKEEREGAAFDSVFSIMLDSLRNTPRPDSARIASMNPFSVSYGGAVTEDRYSGDFYKHMRNTCSPALGFASTFYEFVSFLSEHKSTKPIHWSILAGSLSPSECYYIAFMSASELNPMNKKKFKQIANDNCLFRRARITIGEQVSIGHGDSRVDSSWNNLIVGYVGLNKSAFGTKPLDTPQS